MPTTTITTTLAAEPPQRKVTCRYLRRGTQGQCTGEAVDDYGEILLCAKHLGRALELVKARMAQQKR